MHEILARDCAGVRPGAPAGARGRPPSASRYSIRRAVSREMRTAFSATRARIASRGGLTSSAAAVGVGARSSAAKSAMVKSVSWPTPTTTGMSRGADRARQRLLVELPQVLDRTAAAHQQQYVAFGAPARGGERLRELRRGALALHRRRVDHDRDGRIAAPQRGQDVAQGRRRKRGDDADLLRVFRDRALGRRIEQALFLQLLLQAQEALEQGPKPRPAHRLDVELEASARFVQGDQRSRLDALAVGQVPVQVRRAALEHDAIHLRGLVLEGEIQVAGGRRPQVRDLAGDPLQREAALEHVARAAQQLRHAQDRRLARGKVKLHDAGETTLIHTLNGSPVTARKKSARSPILIRNRLFGQRNQLVKF